jgi:hypothetical protein
VDAGGVGPGSVTPPRGSLHVEDEPVHVEDEPIRVEDEPIHVEDEAVHAEDEAVHVEDEAVHAEDESIHAAAMSVRAPQVRPPREAERSWQTTGSTCARERGSRTASMRVPPARPR